MADKCLFCRIANKEIPAKIVYEDDQFVGFHDINPQAPTHVLIVPRRHIASLDDLTEAETGLMGTLVLRTAQLARTLHLTAEGYRLVVNTGAAAGQTVFHIHVHLMGGRNFGWPPG
jgi:histidine triad (HIT) family protein